jgi:hypothetical protein
MKTCGVGTFLHASSGGELGGGKCCPKYGPAASSLGRMQSTFLEWEQSMFRSVRKDLVRLRHELENKIQWSLYVGSSPRERQLMARISKLLA